MQAIIEQHAHHASAEQVLELLGVAQESGLDLFEAARRREQYGANRLTERKGISPVVLFLRQLTQPLVYILIASAAVTAALKEVVDAAVIFGVVLVNAVVGFAQEAKALGAIRALSHSLTSTATVLRGRLREQVSAEDLVPGDIVLLQSGDKVPADLRLFAARDLQIEESALTGESVPAHKATAPLPRDTALGDRSNMAFSTTLVTFGTGTGVVVATGDSTEVGRISQMIAGVQTTETPLTRRIHEFSRIILFAILGIAALAFGVGILYGEAPVDMFKAAVAMAVGAIPEGLPSAVTIIMAIGVSRMARRRAIIRSLPAVETLGSTSVICSDKTGTLTRNQMTVTRIWAGGSSWELTGTGYDPAGEVRLPGSEEFPGKQPIPEALRACLICGLLCSDAEIREEDGTWRLQGDPTEGALVTAARKAGLSPEQERGRSPRLDTIPFESERQYMATLHERGGGPRQVFVKGSIEAVLSRCLHAPGSPGAGDVRRAAEDMARAGLRVLTFARGELPAGRSTLLPEDLVSGLHFLGLQGMVDPPRPEAAAAVAACRSAGISVKMITGDHAATAAAIAGQVGISGGGGEAAVLTGRDLDSLTDGELVDRVEQTAVFARVSPVHKLRLVEALQARGHVVAMTGDGVNDAPALRKADIGVAMAQGGTEAAREAADMVLTDDNFASIEAAVEEGRGVFDNLRKFIVWTLPTNGGEALVILAAILLGIALPILPAQILWINLTTASFLGMMLSFEPREPGIMGRPPKGRTTPLLDGVLLVRIALVSVLLAGGVFGLYEWELARGASQAQARTAAVAGIVMAELLYLFNCRSLAGSFLRVGAFTNPWILVGAAGMIGAQLAFTYLPLMNRLFRSSPMDGTAWIGVMALAALVSLVVGGEKRLRRIAARRES
jgi:cation-transporting P-type ATPase F